ncbi:uncharacterized protein DUF4280 [Aquimarina sp. MAR_2010_214]|uniref:DUF4280 domain-containing protein n=1 Tax=Aquimarina sp. MAR_2010_214 TaxID=1250026 RepID=UPI000C706D53|nr:DUF4280 domain-containing protein [Aquimarina sp. MAR_2010_214]PKV50746.1 uncharacterized protein DUF4280 [Aquimarina sp. MAR_2010_214]
MSQKYVVVQGAKCKCQFGDGSDTLKITSHSKYYANDKDTADKLIATTMELGGATFEANTFGQCKLQPTGSSFKPCQIVVTKWDGFYEDVTFGNNGQILVEDSKAICPIAGSPCISIISHGQSSAGSVSSAKEADSNVHQQINPMVDTDGIDKEESNIEQVNFS